MNPNLFRSAEFYQRRYHNFATVLIIPLTLLIIFLFAFSFIGQKEVTVSSRGEITPTKVIASIQSTSNNTIIKNNLKENQLVTKGKLLIKYKETMERSQKNSLESQLNTLNKQKVGLETLKESLKQGTNLLPQDDEFGLTDIFNNFMTQSQDIKLGIAKINTEVSNQSALANNTLAAIDTQINTIKQQISEYEDLRQAISNHNTSLPTGNPHQDILNNYLSQSQEEQTATSNQLISQINQTISSLESSLSGLNIQRAGTGSSATYDNSSETKIEVLRTQFLQNASQQLSTIDNQITELKAQLEQANVQLGTNVILAPETGIVHLNNEFEGKSLIPNGSDIAQIYPNITQTRKVLITYYVTSDYVSLLKKGQTVRLNLQKVGKQSITVVGNISTIDKTATKTEQGNLFKVTALAKLPSKESYLIQYGLQGRVTSVIAKKSFFAFYKDKLLSNHD